MTKTIFGPLQKIKFRHLGHGFHSNEKVKTFVREYFQKMDKIFYHLRISKLIQRLIPT